MALDLRVGEPPLYSRVFLLYREFEWVKLFRGEPPLGQPNQVDTTRKNIIPMGILTFDMGKPVLRSGTTDAATEPELLDAVIVGAGFAGLYMLHRLRQSNRTAVMIDRGSDVGGTWYW